MTSYPYTAQDLLAAPEHYHYAPFQGAAFLDSFRRSRAALCERLRATVGAPTDKSPDEGFDAAVARALRGEPSGGGPEPFRERSLAVLPAVPRERAFETRELLLDLWQAHLADPDRVTRRDAWVETLLRRFEVTKRLHVGYTAALRPARPDCGAGENYALLAALLLFRHGRTRGLRELNTALKLIDLLASGDDGRRASMPRALLAAVEAELVAVERLATEHGVAA